MHPVLIFPNQDIDDDQQIAFSEIFGALETTKPGTVDAGSKVVVLTNVNTDGKFVTSNHRQRLNGRGKVDPNLVTDEERAALPPIRQAIVLDHGTRGKSLYIEAHCVEIEGIPSDKIHALIDELVEFASQERFVYRHHWRPHDMIMWDNRSSGIAFRQRNGKAPYGSDHDYRRHANSHGCGLINAS